MISSYDIFLYLLESPQWGDSDNYPKYMLLEILMQYSCIIFSLTVTSWAKVLWHSNRHYNEFYRCSECRYKEDWLYKTVVWCKTNLIYVIAVDSCEIITKQKQIIYDKWSSQLIRDPCSRDLDKYFHSTRFKTLGREAQKKAVTSTDMRIGFNSSFPSSGDCCRMLISFANSLDPDQARQNVGPDLDPNCLTLWWYSWNFCFEKKNN